MVRTSWNKWLVILIFVVTLLIPVQIAAMDKQHVYDFAGLLSDDEVGKLEKVAATYSEKRETDFIILTTDDPALDVKDYMGDFYDEKGFGYDREHGNTAMITINIKTHDVQFGGFGKVEKLLDDSRFEIIQGKITPALSDGDYLDAFTSFITLSSRYMQFKDGANPANPLYNTWVQFGLALILALVIVFGLARNPGMKTTVTANTYRDQQKTKVNQKRDRYIRTAVTKRRKPKQSSGSGGGGPRGGGGGVTRGGRSFSGSRGKF